jgi:hypothetical protein
LKSIVRVVAFGASAPFAIARLHFARAALVEGWSQSV